MDCGAPAEAYWHWDSGQFNLGTLDRFTVLEIWYPRMRSILVQTGADRYREIDVFVRRYLGFPSSEVLKPDGQQVLIVRSHDGGNNTYVFERVLRIHNGAPEVINFAAIDEMVTKMMPAHMSVRIWSNDYASRTYEVHLTRNDLGLPLVMVEDRGTITIRYRLAGNRAVVRDAEYEGYPIEQE
jgi:hypothetical protein